MDSIAERIQMVSIQFVPFLIAVVFHEFAHGFAASKWGDDTAKNMGRLTLNPLPHLDPIGTVFFPLLNMFAGMTLMFGWAKPVPINPNRFTKYRPGLFWVSLAGPLMNFSMAFVSALILCAVKVWLPEGFFFYEPLFAMTYVSVSLNFALGIFNLIPLPPLDGSKVVEAFLPYEAARKYEALSQYSFYILLALLFTGAFSVLSYPIMFLSRFAIFIAASIFGISGF